MCLEILDSGKMAQNILNNVLNSRISPEEIIEWLTTDNHQNLSWVDINQSSTRAEFVAYFLNFLRDQFVSVQQQTNNIKQTPSKKTGIHAKAGVINPIPLKIDNSESSLHDLSKLPDENVKKSKKAVLGTSSQTKIGSDSQENTKQVFESNNLCIKLLGSKKEVLKNKSNKSTENLNDATVATVNAQSSSPVIKKRISLHSVPMKSANFSESNINFSKSSDENLGSREPQNGDLVLTDSNRTFSPGSNSFASMVTDQSTSLNLSSLSQNYNKNDYSDNFSQVSENSEKSELQFSNSPLFLNKSQNPISPLYSQSTTVTPRNSHKSHNRSSERQSRTNNHFQHSTPEQMNSSQKNVKSSSRQNLSLADFITIDTRSSKKSSGKKNNQKMQLLKHSKEEEIASKSTLLLTEESFPEVGRSFERRRRIKPTKLDVSDKKGDKENTVFGIVNRPVTTNPQFSEAQSTDQTSDKISFETERVLLRLERQKKPESADDNKTVEVFDILSKTVRPPRKPVLNKSIVVPSLEMVDQKELLDILVHLYSAFIENNLILNPMTEMYFILSLITTQYLKHKSPCKSVKKSGELTQEDLEVDLGCAFLTEESDKKKDLVLSTGSNVFLLDQTDEKLQELTIDDISNTSHKADEKNSFNVSNSLKIDDLHLGTPHNCVYLSVRVLKEVKHLLKSLDRTTLKLLSENAHIATFQPDLQDYLIQLYNLKLSEVNRTKQQHNFSITDLNVCFQIDTDNRENFPSAITFQCFRKQRDMFYEILKIWEENHTKSNWKFAIALSGKIKSMLGLHSDLTNYSHIARLFKSQLLISCIRSGQQEDFIDDESLRFLKSLKGVNPEKLTQLTERLVTPLSSQGPVPEPSFPGVQEFYKNFIIFAFNPMFYSHLEDCLIHEIMEFNDAQFTGSDIEDTETMVDERTRQNFITCLSSIRLLAKFMGFLVSLPYRSTTSALDEVINAQVALRSRIVPSLNLQGCLQEAIIQGKLSLTIPWIVEYLSQMDIASLRLPYYIRLLEMLYCIYRISDSDTFVNSEKYMSQPTSVLIKFSLGWLFELSHFPTDLYFSWQSNYTLKKLTTFCEIENRKIDVSVSSDKRNTSLDKLDIIDDRVLYSCCPFLVEFKVLLITGNSQLTNSKSNRHITPVSSQLPNTSDSTSSRDLEFQLEEAFFHGQPASTRKTVEFVSERVASTCVKYICNSLLPSAREKSLNELRKVVEENYNGRFEDNPTSLKTFMMKDMNTLAMSLSKQVKEQCEKVIPSMCKKRASQSIEFLLAEDTLLPVKETCAQIAVRMAIDRIAQWIQSHIVGGTLFMRDMESEINRIVKNDNSVTNASNNHNPEAACPTDVLDKLRDCMWELMDNKGESITFDTLAKILDELCSCFTERVDLIHGPETCIRTMSVDLSLLLVTYRTDLFTIEIQEKFVKFWKISLKRISEIESPFLRLLSPRNIIILDERKNDTVWFKCGQFIKLLLKQEILSLESLSDQCVVILRQDWPTETLQNLSKCLNIGIEDYRATDEQAERIRYLIQWIAETYKDIDNLDM